MTTFHRKSSPGWNRTLQRSQEPNWARTGRQSPGLEVGRASGGALDCRRAFSRSSHSAISAAVKSAIVLTSGLRSVAAAGTTSFFGSVIIMFVSQTRVACRALVVPVNQRTATSDVLRVSDIRRVANRRMTIGERSRCPAKVVASGVCLVSSPISAASIPGADAVSDTRTLWVLWAASSPRTSSGFLGGTGLGGRYPSHLSISSASFI